MGAFLALALINPTVLTVNLETVPTEDSKDRWIAALVNCESGGNENIKVLDTDGFYSYGLGQFHMKTWLDYGKDLGATKENIYDGELQREVIRNMLDHGGQGHWWTCGNRVVTRLGSYPS